MSYVNYFEGSNQAPLRPRKQSPDEPNWLEDVWKVVPRRAVITGLLALALLAFEIFNFDTTRYALTSFLGEIRFLSIGWATILAIAFCAIDFAGLVRVFTPETGKDEPKEVWYLMGAWLLGATLNAIMTWWAVNLALLNHNFGNEVLSRDQLLQYVPIFVAVLVWLTRILFIGSLSVAGEKLLGKWDSVPKTNPASTNTNPKETRPHPQPTAPFRTPQPIRSHPASQPTQATAWPPRPTPGNLPITDDVPEFLRPNRPVQPMMAEADEDSVLGESELVRPMRPQAPQNRVRQRPPTIGNSGLNPAGMQAKSRR
ncbi:MAG: hypothetical protein KA314_06435 [Chloroflexi bacterium]|nr:hypothetical protein [Chloroflexota bacterium]MBP8055461.1 hypothetical protein [Chloroflexota bacterium]